MKGYLKFIGVLEIISCIFVWIFWFTLIFRLKFSFELVIYSIAIVVIGPALGVLFIVVSDLISNNERQYDMLVRQGDKINEAIKEEPTELKGTTHPQKTTSYLDEIKKEYNSYTTKGQTDAVKNFVNKYGKKE